LYIPLKVAGVFLLFLCFMLMVDYLRNYQVFVKLASAMRSESESSKRAGLSGCDQGCHAGLDAFEGLSQLT
jgi:hypothetical protein